MMKSVIAANVDDHVFPPPQVEKDQSDLVLGSNTLEPWMAREREINSSSCLSSEERAKKKLNSSGRAVL